SGLTSGAGTLTINGVSIAYDTTTDTLATVISRINSSSAGVTASLNRGTDKLVLTSRTGGAAPIAIADTGALATALKLAPGTTDAQTLGTQAQVTVDGKTYTADTNKVSTAVEGVTITLLAEGTSTMTVSPDTTAVSASLTTLVTAYNALADSLDTVTANSPTRPRGTLAGEPDVRSLALNLRRALTSQVSTSGAFTTLADIGLTSGALGSKVGTTTRLVLDSAKLTAALEANSSSVSSLLNGSSGAFASMATTLGNWTTTGGRISSSLTSITSQMTQLDSREAAVNTRIALRQASLEAKFTAMEKNLALMQTTTNSLNNQVSQMNKSSG
ncbi:MAG: flagellar filament capping protein FliD, partial [Chloroflexota bacterium]